jgi:hypothetical protein
MVASGVRVAGGPAGAGRSPGALRAPEVTTQHVQAKLQHFLAVVGVGVGGALHRQPVQQCLHEAGEGARRHRPGPALVPAFLFAAGREVFGEIAGHVRPPILVQLGEALAEVLPVADLREEGVLQGVELRDRGRLE